MCQTLLAPKLYLYLYLYLHHIYMYVIIEFLQQSYAVILFVIPILQKRNLGTDRLSNIPTKLLSGHVRIQIVMSGLKNWTLSHWWSTASDINSVLIFSVNSFYSPLRPFWLQNSWSAQICEILYYHHRHHHPSSFPFC